MRSLFSILIGIMLLTGISNAQVSSDSAAASDTLQTAEQQPQTDAPNLQTSPVLRPNVSMNPDISAIGDFRTSYSSEGPRNIETYFNALEVHLSSVVDPYARANFLFAFGKDSLNGDFSAGLEVATLTSIALPYSMEVTLGRFKPQFTKVNTLHPHAFSFVEFPAMIGHFFGDEGLFMEGLSASILLPNPWDFFQELEVEIGRSVSNPSLDNGTGNTLMTSAHLANFFELSDNSTFGLGLSGLKGVNPLGLNAVMAGIDLTYKWKPVQFNTYRSFTWQTEALISRSDTSAGNPVQSYGAYSLFEYQLERRTYIGARFDYSGLPMTARSDERSASLLFRFQPTEFQVFALEFRHVNSHSVPSYQQVMFRAIFGIGTHAAHAY